VNVGIIGAGKIVPFHIDALRAAGFFIMGISASENSISAKKMADNYIIPYYFSSTDKLLDNTKLFDALLVAPKSSALFPLISKISNIQLPSLFEKPVFSSDAQIQQFESFTDQFEKIMVGYNRRFYKTISFLKQEIQNRGLLSLRMFVPELSSIKSPTSKERVETVINNSVHMIDLFTSLTGLRFNELQVKVVQPRAGHFIVQLEIGASKCEIVFGIPNNYLIEAITLDGGVFVLKPLENLVEYQGMQVIEPDLKIPFRRYLPKIKLEMDAFEGPVKPGFLGQAKAFKHLVETGTLSPESCTLQNAAKISQLAFKISEMII
jgi:predicted dehydrogenase